MFPDPTTFLKMCNADFSLFVLNISSFGKSKPIKLTFDIESNVFSIESNLIGLDFPKILRIQKI